MLAHDARLQDRYRIVRRLGEGGQGAVYEAYDERLKLRIALKQAFYSDDRARLAFEREALLLARLKHDALPRVIDHFSEAAGQFLVMEFAPGDDLGEMLRKHRQPFPVSDVLAWGAQLLTVLEYLHGQQPPIIHRDIKPQNLKLDARGQIVLLDFGLAKDADASTILRGYSRHYSPLEQMRGRGTDARSDFYAVGATLYHLLTNNLPAEADARDEAVSQDQPDPLTPASTLNPQVPRALDEWLAQALALRREQRPVNAAAMRAQLLELSKAAAIVLPQTHSETEPLATNGEAEVALPATPFNAATTLPDPRRTAVAPAQQPVIARAAAPLTTQPTATTRRNNRRAVIAVAIAAVAMLALFGWLALKKPASDSGATTTPTPTNAALPSPMTTNATPANPTTPLLVEALRYQFALIDRRGRSSRVAELPALAAEQSFRFRFLPQRRGYLYIVAPGENNVPTTLLTALPAPETGVATNLLEANQEWEFPRGREDIDIDRNLSEQPFTIIFAPQALDAPAFLAARALRLLNDDEQREFDQWRRQWAPVTVESIVTAPLMAVKVAPDRLEREPVVFEIKVKRQ